MRSVYKLLFTGVVATQFVGCGDGRLNPHKSSSNDDLQVVDHSDAVTPPQEYYEHLFKKQLALFDSGSYAANSNPATLFVNFEGQTVSKGFEIDESFLVCEDTATIPPANFSASEKSDVLRMVKKRYADAGVSINITDVRPQSQPYTTIIVGGSLSDLNCPENRGTLGLAPLDEKNLNASDIGFVFTKYMISLAQIGDAIAHEAGHTFGLEHINEDHGVMFHSISANISGFIVGTTVQGTTQNAPALLRKYVGGDVIPDNGDKESDNEKEDNKPHTNTGSIIETLLSIVSPVLIPSLFGSEIANLILNLINNKGSWSDLLDDLSIPKEVTELIDSVANQDFGSLIELISDMRFAQQNVLAMQASASRDNTAASLKIGYAQAFSNLQRK